MSDAFKVIIKKFTLVFKLYKLYMIDPSIVFQFNFGTKIYFYFYFLVSSLRKKVKEDVEF